MGMGCMSGVRSRAAARLGSGHHVKNYSETRPAPWQVVTVSPFLVVARARSWGLKLVGKTLRYWTPLDIQVAVYMSWRNVALSLSRSDSDPEHDSWYLWLHPSPAPLAPTLQFYTRQKLRKDPTFSWPPLPSCVFLYDRLNISVGAFCMYALTAVFICIARWCQCNAGSI